MASKKKSSKKSSSKKAAPMSAAAAAAAAAADPEAMATLLAFANPADTTNTAARECVAGGLAAIGIGGPFQPTFEIDFGAIDPTSCIDFANFIELCVDEKGFRVPALGGVFVRAHQRGTVITFANLVKTISELMQPN